MENPRRKWLRCAAKFPVKLQVVDSRRKRIWAGTGSTVNIGGGGAMLEVQKLGERLTEGLVKGEYDLQLAIQMPEFFFVTRVRARVRWVEEYSDEGKSLHRLGVTFENLPKEKEDRIVNYVENQVVSEIARYSLMKSFEKTGKDAQRLPQA